MGEADGATALDVVINGHVLPVSLARLLRAGRWQAPDRTLLAKVFGERGFAPCFYEMPLLISENESWARETRVSYLGRRTAGGAWPGTIEPARSVLIGDLGPDCPFALDYRSGHDDPTVVFLSASSDRWRMVARSFSELVVSLGLDRGS